MTTNKEKFLALVTEQDTSTMKNVEYRIKNRDWLKESGQIALMVIMRIKELSWTQKYLAEQMNIRPQQVNKILRGKQNLTLETLVKLQKILGIGLLSTYHESKDDKAIKIGNTEMRVVAEYPKRKTNNPIPGAAAHQHL